MQMIKPKYESSADIVNVLKEINQTLKGLSEKRKAKPKSVGVFSHDKIYRDHIKSEIYLTEKHLKAKAKEYLEEGLINQMQYNTLYNISSHFARETYIYSWPVNDTVYHIFRSTVLFIMGDRHREKVLSEFPRIDFKGVGNADD